MGVDYETIDAKKGIIETSHGAMRGEPAGESV